MSKRNKPQISGYEKIIKAANALLAAITEQGYCVRSQGDFGSVNIYLHGIGTRNKLVVENITNAKEKWRINGKLTAPLIAEKEEAGE
jgi:hypothetical protein